MANLAHKSNPDDIFLWPNHDFCTRYEYDHEGFGSDKSDDFMVIPFESSKWYGFTTFVDATDFGGKDCICEQCGPLRTY